MTKIKNEKRSHKYTLRNGMSYWTLGRWKLASGNLHSEMVVQLKSAPIFLLESTEKENEGMVEKLYLKKLAKAFWELKIKLSFLMQMVF